MYEELHREKHTQGTGSARNEYPHLKKWLLYMSGYCEHSLSLRTSSEEFEVYWFAVSRLKYTRRRKGSLDNEIVSSYLCITNI